MTDANISAGQQNKADKYVVRFTEPGMRDRIKRLAARNERSINGEIMYLLKRALREEAPGESAK